MRQGVGIVRRQLLRVAGAVLAAVVVWTAAPVRADEFLVAELPATLVPARTASPVAGTAPTAALSRGPGRNAPSLGAPLGVGQATPGPGGGAAATATAGAALQRTAVAPSPTALPSAPATLTVPP